MNPTYQHYATHDESDYPHLWRGAVGAWAPCLGPSGLRLHDHSGRANWGTLTNMDAATDWVVDGGQYALDFDGTNDLVELPWTLFSGLTRATLSGWFRRTVTSSFSGFFGAGVSGSQSNRFVVQAWTDGSVYASIGNAWGFFPSNDLQGHHIVAIYDGTKSTNSERLNIFFDGKHINLSFVSTIATSLGSPNAFWLGRTFNAANNYGSGQVDDVIAWNRSLGFSEATQLYQIGRGGMYTPRRRRRAYSFGPSFLAAWARGSNVIVQPCGVN